MNKANVTLTTTDPEPPAGTHLAIGAPTGGDRVTFIKTDNGWLYAYGNSTLRPCTYELVEWWLPARIVGGPLVTVNSPLREAA